MLQSRHTMLNVNYWELSTAAKMLGKQDALCHAGPLVVNGFL